LRAVRNEMNQAVNFVCLFEDMTELAGLRAETETLKNSIAGIASISEDISAPNSGKKDVLNEEIMHLTGSCAVARYTYDRTETIRLSNSYGNWPEKLKTGEPADLALPASVWRGDEIRVVKPPELGNLSSFFSCAIILPIGKGVSNRGYLLLCDPALSEKDSTILRSVASLTGLMLGRDAQTHKAQSSERFGSLRDSPYSELLRELPFPMALVRKDGSAELWNSAMETLTGVSSESQTSEDLQALLDPDDKGLTLDSLASSDIPFTGGESLIWAVRRKDGTESPLHRWHVAIVEQPQMFQGDYGFLVASVPCHDGTFDSQENSVFRKQCIDMLQSFTRAVTSNSESEILQAVWNICSDLSSTEGLEFHRNGELVALFPTGSVEPSSAYAHGDTGPSLLLDGVEYEVRTAGDISVPLVESVCEMLSTLRGACGSLVSYGGEESMVLQKTLRRIVAYLQEFCEESIKQNSAVLTMTEQSDPLAGFARTMLFSHETAARATSLLNLALEVSREDFRRLVLQKFMSGFHTCFAESGMRPPSLSMAQGLPEVTIIPGVVLQGIAMLCMIKSTQSVLRFSVTREIHDGKPEAALRIRGFEESLEESEVIEGWENLEKGIFDQYAETALIYKILEAAGCRIVFDRSPDCTLIFHSENLNG